MIDPWTPRFDPRGARDHVESHFMRVNDPDRPRALWIKWTTLRRSSDEAVAETWAIAFDRARGHVAEKERTAAKDARLGEAIEIAGSVLTMRRAAGRVGSIAFDLALEARGAPMLLYPSERLYSERLPSQKTLTPVPDLVARGSITVRGEAWDVRGWRGMIGHNWGRRHTPRYAWAHVSSWDFDRPFSQSRSQTQREEPSDLVLEGFTGWPLGRALRLTALVARVRGVRFAWNAVTELARNHGRIEDHRAWRFAARSAHGTIEGELAATTGDFVGLTYENPRGPALACLNTKLARARVRVALFGRPPIEASSERGALEIGTHDRDHGIRMYL